MRIATWNVNSIRAHDSRVLRWLEVAQPDVIALQEIMCVDRAFPRHGFAALGYEVAVHGRAGSGGVALASRLPMADIERGVAGAVAPFDEPRLLSATVDGIRVHSVYAPNGRRVGTDAHRFKLAWFAFLGHVIAADIGHYAEVLVLADLNIAPTDQDVWDASKYRQRNLTSAAERAAYLGLIEAGLVDVVRMLHPTAPNFTWWNRRADFYATDRGWRLDHILATADLAGRITGGGADRAARAEPGPDHAPVVADIGAA